MFKIVEHSDRPVKIPRVSHQSINQSILQSINQPINQTALLFNQPSYFMPGLLGYLSDFDVVLNFLLTCKLVKQSIIGSGTPYSIKRIVTPAVARRVSANQYLSVTVTRMHRIQKVEDFIDHKSLKEMELTLDNFDWSTHRKYLCESLPKSVTTLDFVIFRARLSWLPNTLTTLRLNDVPKDRGPWPGSLTHLEIRNYWKNVPIHPSLCSSSLTSLYLGKDFNHPIPPGCLPATLIRFAFGQDYTFGNSYSHTLEPGSIPNNVKYLKMAYTKPLLPGVIPKSVTHLWLGHEFDNRIEPGAIPAFVQFLDLGSAYKQPVLIGMIPNSVNELVFYQKLDQDIELEALPSSLTYLTGYPTSASEYVRLPASVTYLHLPHWLEFPIVPGLLPSKIKHLTFGELFDQLLTPGSIPQSVTHLKFGGKYNQPIVAGVLPPSLTYLKFGEFYNQPIPPGSLPNSITHLIFGDPFNQPAHPMWLPTSLIWLELGNSYSQAITPDLFPSSLITLKMSNLSSAFKHILSNPSLPPSLKHFVIRNGELVLANYLADRLRNIPMNTSVTIASSPWSDYRFGLRMDYPTDFDLIAGTAYQPHIV